MLLSSVNISNFYIKQSFYVDNPKKVSFARESTSNNILDFFSLDKQGRNTRLLSLEAEQGEGKSTAIKQTTFSWCEKILTDEYQNDQRKRYLQPYIQKAEEDIQGMIKTQIPKVPEFFRKWHEKWVNSEIVQPMIDSFRKEKNLLISPSFLQPIPKLVLTFEFKDLCGGIAISDTVSKMVNFSVSRENVDQILDDHQNKILIIFDGYDEEFYICPETNQMMEEARRIIQREDRRKYNLIITTRHSALKFKKVQFEKLPALLAS